MKPGEIIVETAVNRPSIGPQLGIAGALLGPWPFKGPCKALLTPFKGPSNYGSDVIPKMALHMEFFNT